MQLTRRVKRSPPSFVVHDFQQYQPDMGFVACLAFALAAFSSNDTLAFVQGEFEAPVFLFEDKPSTAADPQRNRGRHAFRLSKTGARGAPTRSSPAAQGLACPEGACESTPHNTSTHP